MSIKSLSLLSGNKVPWVAFGTGTALYQQDCADACKQALKLGFRHLDAAQMYQNEQYVGQAIEYALSPQGLNLRREDLYITTKLAQLGPGETVEESLTKSLQKLKVQAVDLFLIHIPTQHFEREGSIEQVWREMVGVKTKGLAKSVGVSNFNKSHLERVIALGIGKPEVNQIEYHPLVAKKLEPLIKFSNDQGIITASYGGLTPILPGRGEKELEAVRPKISAAIDKLAKARGEDVTPNQILLKWLQKRNILAVTTSSKESRVKEYLYAEKITDLTDEEDKEIADAAGSTHFRAFAYFPFMDE